MNFKYVCIACGKIEHSDRGIFPPDGWFKHLKDDKAEVPVCPDVRCFKRFSDALWDTNNEPFEAARILVGKK